jgi:[ribosomal protein S5]-alanine N-acetyltransferase
VIGSLHFSQVSRGAFQSAMLGYALDEAHVGQGLMNEAIAAGLEEMFSPRVNLHRVQAAYRPENVRSARVLEGLGFEKEGLAPAYLYIDGAWRDHVITALRNPAFVAPEGW